MTGADRVLRIAHRAGNQLALVAPALEQGADLIEADVHTRRGRLEIRHGRSLGPLPWLWEPWYLVRSQALVLADLAAHLPAGSHVMLDLKGWQPWLGRRVRDGMQQGAPDVPYTVCTRRWTLLDDFEGLEHVRVVHSARTLRELRLLPQRLTHHATWGVSVHHRLLSAARVAALRTHAEVVMTWPIDTARAYDEVVALGVGAVISNDLLALPREVAAPDAAVSPLIVRQQPAAGAAGPPAGRRPAGG